MSPERAHVFWNGTFSDEKRALLLQTQLPNALDGILGDLRAKFTTSADPYAPFLWFDQKYFLPDDILTKVDRMSMAHSVEVRPPFLDHRIVEFAATLPSSLKIQGSRQKVILKELMQNKLPPAVLTRKKVGFDIPAHQWLRGPLRDLLMDTVNAGLVQNPGLFQPKVVQSLLQAHMDRRANLGYHLWGLMILFLWMKEWRIQATPSPASHYSAPERTGIST